MNKQKAFYLNFSGWIDLDVDTNMRYIGTKEDPHCITVAEWSQLSSSKKEEYTIDNFEAAYSNAIGVPSFEDLYVEELEF